MAEARSFAPVERDRAAPTEASVFFGGPDRPAGRLRDLLEAKTNAVPPGGAIDWMTYYFCDLELAEALVRAHRRGVRVRVCLEGAPRHRGANDVVIRRLADGLGAGLTVVRHAIPRHLHAKVYAFSGPSPCALVGSFNPSGQHPDDPALTADIGDQDRGHNVLVAITSPEMVAALVDRIAAVHAGTGALRRAVATGEAVADADRCEAVFFPFRPANPLEQRLASLAPGATLRIAASHLRDPQFAERLAGLAARGVRVEVLTHHTARRAPPAIERRLAQAGVAVARYAHPEGLPMHCKFVLAQDRREGGGGGLRRWVAFGSYNFTLTSRWLNQELLMFSDDRGLWSAFDVRWGEIMGEPWVVPAAVAARRPMRRPHPPPPPASADAIQP
jgi:phosphatidylserine/phosphatidylglycerophosphate/cardiolipin synthase-like enzyme